MSAFYCRGCGVLVEFATFKNVQTEKCSDCLEKESNSD